MAVCSCLLFTQQLFREAGVSLSRVGKKIYCKGGKGTWPEIGVRSEEWGLPLVSSCCFKVYTSGRTCVVEFFAILIIFNPLSGSPMAWWVQRSITWTLGFHIETWSSLDMAWSWHLGILTSFLVAILWFKLFGRYFSHFARWRGEEDGEVERRIWRNPTHGQVLQGDRAGQRPQKGFQEFWRVGFQSGSFPHVHPRGRQVWELEENDEAVDEEAVPSNLNKLCQGVQFNRVDYRLITTDARLHRRYRRYGLKMWLFPNCVRIIPCLYQAPWPAPQSAGGEVVGDWVGCIIDCAVCAKEALLVHGTQAARQVTW